MLFNSIEYLVFYIIVISVSYSLRKYYNIRLIFLLLASIYFYYSNNGYLIILLFFSTIIDYIIGLKLYSVKKILYRKILLLLSLFFNLGLLFFFKYYDFVGESIVNLYNLFGNNYVWVNTNIVLPVGISFYTFQTLSYSIDVYRKKLLPERSFVKFSLFVMFFPQLIAGPIVRASDFLPQLKKKVFDYKKYDKYIFIIFVGLFKKIVLADYLSFFADYTFNNPASGDFLTTITGIYSFCFQIYFDFSGYSDIAIGTAGLLGYKIPLNFNNPYSAGSITDFWRKWHISLSGWLKDYLYISLGGNRMKTRIGVYRNLFITMFLGGLWHGANLTFLVWGIIQGFLLIVEKYFKIKINNKNVLMKIFIFHLICISWIVFRIQKLEDFSCIINSLFRTPKEWSLNGQLILVYVIVLATYVYQNINVEINLKRYFLRLNIIYKSFVYALVIMSIILFTETTAKPFIYFQF